MIKSPSTSLWHTMRNFSKIVLLLLVLGAETSRAGELSEPGVSNDSTSFEDAFSRGRFEASLNSGALFSPFVAYGGRPTINYSITEVQVGYMLADVKGRGWWRGNFEVVGEGFGSGIFEGPGSFIAGATVWGRYNFVQRGWRFVPFFQAGMGLTSTDIPRRYVGQPFNFNLELGGGVRCFLTERWALNLEFRYQHISNANTGRHNLGINSAGPILGLSYLF